MSHLQAMFAQTFTNYWERYRYMPEGYITDSTYDPDASRVGWDGDTMVTHFGVWRFPVRVGRAVLQAACIGGVATHDRYRKRGLMAQTAADSIASFRRLGYDATMLFGIRGFYGRFGYVTSSPEYRYRIARTALPQCELADFVERPRTDRHALMQLSELYNRQHESITMTMVRPTYGRNRKPDSWTLWTWGPSEAPAGYVVVRIDADEVEVVDAAGEPLEIAAAARRVATGAVCPHICFVFTPPRSELGRYLRTLNCTVHVTYSANGGPMLRLVNLRSTLEKVSPILAERLAASAAAGYHGVLRVSVADTADRSEVSDGRSPEVETVDLVLDAGTVRVIAADPGVRPTATIDGDHRFSRMIFGCGPVEESGRGQRLSDDAAVLAPILFPDQAPSVVLWDRF